MSYTIKPSVGMLPIDDLVEVLATKLQDKLAPTNPIVNNAKMLGGIPAEDYMLKTYSNEIEANFGEVWTNNSDEIQLLRDELYQLKNELIKKNLIEDTLVADGFIDPFNNESIKYDERNMDITSITPIGVNQRAKIFSEGDWLVVKKRMLKPESYVLASIEGERGNFVELNINTYDLSENATILGKTLGQYINNTFSFSDTVDNKESGYSVGLYTSKKPIVISKCIKASRPRLTLEIEKEGQYKVMPRRSNDPLNLIRVDNMRNMFTVGDKIIIGTDIAEIVSISDKTKIIINKNLCPEENASIYKCNYDAKIKTYILEENQETGFKTIKTNSELIHNLELVGVIPARDKASNVSDRLIFECNDIDKDFNAAELQIKWESSYNGPLENEFIGRIYGLNLAFDRRL